MKRNNTLEAAEFWLDYKVLEGNEFYRGMQDD